MSFHRKATAAEKMAIYTAARRTQVRQQPMQLSVPSLPEKKQTGKALGPCRFAILNRKAYFSMPRAFALNSQPQ